MRLRPAWRRAARARIACAWVAVLVLAFGCAPPPRPGGLQAPARRARPGYERLADSLQTVDLSGLAGRRIVLDPGHGGFYPGALGVHGLTEATVNLAVALELKALLEGAGARVQMTRTTDRDFLAGTDSTLRADLAERARIANAFDPDLFLSIHHNADPGGRHDVNEIQTYYRLGDEGPSLDVAQDVHRSLVRNVGIDRHRVVPGNFFVLRATDAPGLLTETSYITNPEVEARLRQPAKQRLEAEALLVGIARYFARPLPVVAAFAALRASGAPDSVFAGAEEPVIVARIAGAFDRVALEVDGEAVTPVRNGDRIEWRPPSPLAAGPHAVRLDVRLAGVGSARSRRLAFAVRRPVAAVTARARGMPAPGAVRAVRFELRDAAGLTLSHPDSVPVAVRAIAAGATGSIAPRETTLVCRNGVAWGYFRARTARPLAFTVRVPATDGRSSRALSVTATAAPAPAWAGFAREMPTAAPLDSAPGTREPRPTVAWINRDGFAVLERDSTGALAVPALPGFRRHGPLAELPPAWVAVAGGALHGRRIVIDPEGGGGEAAGIGAGGARAANLNLETARILAGHLAAAGAEVRLTRDGDRDVSDVERVQISEAFRADRYLRIGHRAEAPRAGHYFASAAGRRWAERTRQALAAFGFGGLAVAEEAQYPITQTSCVALYVSSARIDRPEEEDRLVAPGTLRAEAYALFLALAREWAPEAEWPLDSLVVRDPEGRPAPGAFVTLGDALVLETDAQGIARFARTEPGPIEARVRLRGAAADVVLLDLERGRVVTGTRGP